MTPLLLLGLVAAVVLFVVFAGISALFLRRVVPTNEVHIVQTRKKTTPYGKDESAGNSYYEWPSWFPAIGMTKVVLPVSIFAINLRDYPAYDKERVPFRVDIMAFFRTNDPNTAAQRVSSFDELEDQLTAIVQGASRTVLASHEIDKIMLERSTFGSLFTEEVSGQLKNWGVESVKNIELMDIRDDEGSKVIANIMAKRTSAIEKESRVAVAENHRTAEMAEIEARREVELQNQQAQQQVGQRTAEKDKAVGIADEQAKQEVLTQQRETVTRHMQVSEVQNVRTAEITRAVNLVKADENRQVAIVVADGEKQQTVLLADGELEAKRREATGIEVEGSARAAAEKAMQLAPVEAQIVLAKEIGENKGYQAYLIGVRNIEATQAVGIAQARALEDAGIKIIANTGNVGDGIKSITDLFSPAGGTAVGGMLEALNNTDAGKAVVEKFVHKEAS